MNKYIQKKEWLSSNYAKEKSFFLWLIILPMNIINIISEQIFLVFYNIIKLTNRIFYKDILMFLDLNIGIPSFKIYCIYLMNLRVQT